MKRRNIFKLALGGIAGAFTGFSRKNVEASTPTDDQNWIEVDDWLPTRKDCNFKVVYPYSMDGDKVVINPDWVNAPYEEKFYYITNPCVNDPRTKSHLWTRKAQ